MRRLMRLVVTSGFGKKAEVAGYFPGGKTGTAEKNSGHGYKKHANVSAFMCVFPMQAPRYAVYMMLDEPHGNAATGFYSTAGQVAAPAVGKVITRIGPILGLMPDIENAPAIEQALAIPLQPAHGLVLGSIHVPEPRNDAPLLSSASPSGASPSGASPSGASPSGSAHVAATPARNQTRPVPPDLLHKTKAELSGREQLGAEPVGSSTDRPSATRVSASASSVSTIASH
jgi:membrane peptidoglycan carboxypeptidase